MVLSESQKALIEFFNPTKFVTIPQNLKGREPELKEGLLYLMSGECVIVQGARRIGKTSFLHCLGTLCSEQGKQYAYISFQRVTKYDISTFVYHLIQQLCLKFNIPRSELNNYDLFSSLKELSQIIEAKLDYNGYIIVLIDEFQVTEELRNCDKIIFYNQLRNVIDERPIHPELNKFVFVISTSQSLLELSQGISSTLASSFSKTFVLGTISNQSCSDLISQPFAGIIPIDKRIIDFVTYESGGHPYLIKLLIHNTLLKNVEDIFSSSRQHDIQELMEIEVRILIDNLNHPHFEMLQNILTEFELLVLYEIYTHKSLSLLDVRQKLTEKNLNQLSSLRKTLDHLENLQILRREDELYYFSNGIYTKWFSLFFTQYYTEHVLSMPSTEQEGSQMSSMISILFLSADPTDATRLRLGEEIREIREKLLQLATLRDQFELHERTSVRPVDLTQALLDINPQIVHFSGHGNTNGALCLEDKLGKVHLVEPEALSETFKSFSQHVNCVILNACYSENQAKAIVKHIQYVIGMNQAIGDQAAIAFATGFYQALGAGRSIEEAYDLGCVQIRLQGISEHLVPVPIKKIETV